MKKRDIILSVKREGHFAHTHAGNKKSEKIVTKMIKLAADKENKMTCTVRPFKGGSSQICDSTYLPHDDNTARWQGATFLLTQDN